MTLKAHNRWCISGTPIQNGASDMITLLEFIGFARKDAKKRLKEIVGERMLLRTKAGTGIELPAIKRKTVDIKMSESEFRVYDFVDEHIEFQLVRQLKKRQATILKRMVNEFYNGEYDDIEEDQLAERNIDNFRLDKTLEIALKVENAVIFADFRAEMEYLKNSLKPVADGLVLFTVVFLL